MRDEKMKQPLTIPCVVKPSKKLYLLMPLVGFSILAGVYISSLKHGYLPDLRFVMMAICIIAILSILMIFVVNIYNIKFEYDHFEWRDFIRKNELPYSIITCANAFSGMKGKREYSYIEVTCSTREKPCRIDTRYFNKYGKSMIIRLICMKVPEVKLNWRAECIRDMTKESVKLDKIQMILVGAVVVVFSVLEIWLRLFWRK